MKSIRFWRAVFFGIDILMGECESKLIWPQEPIRQTYTEQCRSMADRFWL